MHLVHEQRRRACRARRAPRGPYASRLGSVTFFTYPLTHLPTWVSAYLLAYYLLACFHLLACLLLTNSYLLLTHLLTHLPTYLTLRYLPLRLEEWYGFKCLCARCQCDDPLQERFTTTSPHPHPHLSPNPKSTPS